MDIVPAMLRLVCMRYGVKMSRLVHYTLVCLQSCFKANLWKTFQIHTHTHAMIHTHTITITLIPFAFGRESNMQE